MSLIDSLLLDPYPLNIYIAARTDSVQGDVSRTARVRTPTPESGFRRTNPLIASLLLIFFTSGGFGNAQSTTIISPNVGPLGNTPNGAPFFTAFDNRFQQVYNASEFLQAVPSGGYLTQIAFRNDTFQGGIFATISNLQVNFSTTGKTAADLSTVFSQNVGADDTVVFGPQRLVLTRPPGTRNFDYIIPFTTPFFYDPRMGSLLLDVRNFSGTHESDLGFPQMDGDSRPTNPVSAILAVGANSSTANGGVGFGVGLITQFTFTPIPEPTCLALVSCFVTALAFRAARKRFKRD